RPSGNFRVDSGRDVFDPRFDSGDAGPSRSPTVQLPEIARTPSHLSAASSGKKSRTSREHDRTLRFGLNLSQLFRAGSSSSILVDVPPESRVTENPVPTLDYPLESVRQGPTTNLRASFQNDIDPGYDVSDYIGVTPGDTRYETRFPIVAVAEFASTTMFLFPW
ncbi:hypothetical protein HDU93_004736, partial [Gonapodya sp. JEL0774]